MHEAQIPVLGVTMVEHHVRQIGLPGKNSVALYLGLRCKVLGEKRKKE